MKSIVQRRSESKWWYGRVEVNGKVRPIPLDVKVEGTPPKHRGAEGDEAFKHSKWEAEKRIKPLLKKIEGMSLPESTEAIKRFGEQMKLSKKGGANESASKYLLAEDLASEWSKLPRKSRKAKEGKSKNDGKSHGDQMVSKINKFVEFCQARQPKLKYAFEISKADAEAFIQAEWDRRITGSSCNKIVVNLRSVFSRLRNEIGYTHNPFDNIEKFPEDTIHRKPFSESQIDRLYREAMKELSGVGGIILAGIFTGMREGDCCLLRWEEVDLEQNAYEATPEPSAAAKQNMKTGETIWVPMFPQFKEALKRLNPKKSGYVFPEIAKLYRGKPDEISKKVVKFIERTFIDDENFVRTVERKHGLRKASIHDFPALRTTWVTLAVKSGVPTALICLVTGHTSEEMILKNYLKPDKKSLQATFEMKMQALSNLGKTSEDLYGDLGTQLRRLKELLSDGSILDIERQRKWASELLSIVIKQLKLK